MFFFSIFNCKDDARRLRFTGRPSTPLETRPGRWSGPTESGSLPIAGRVRSRSVESLFRAGRVLAAIRDRLKSQRKWTEWQNDHKVGTTSAWQAIKLFEAAGSEEAVADLTRTEALIKFGITERCAEK